MVASRVCFELTPMDHACDLSRQAGRAAFEADVGEWYADTRQPSGYRLATRVIEGVRVTLRSSVSDLKCSTVVGDLVGPPGPARPSVHQRFGRLAPAKVQPTLSLP